MSTVGRSPTSVRDANRSVRTYFPLSMLTESVILVVPSQTTDLYIKRVLLSEVLIVFFVFFLTNNVISF